MCNFLKGVYAIIFLTAFTAASGQDLLKGLEDSVPATEKVFGAFKSTRVINAHSTEMLFKGNLDFRILHRFDAVNTSFGGLDAAKMRIGIDYGITNNLMVGIGRSTLHGEVDGFVKGRILQQSKGAKAVPFSLLVAVGAMVYSKDTLVGEKLDLSDHSAYYVQVVIGRKFSNKFSLQLSPIVVHRNLVISGLETNNTFAIGGGARYKVSKRIALTIDYHHPVSKLPANIRDPLSVGVDIETGGRVFQLHFSNAIGMNERAYITETQGKFFNGDIRFGFNLSRMFKLRKHST